MGPYSDHLSQVVAGQSRRAPRSPASRLPSRDHTYGVEKIGLRVGQSCGLPVRCANACKGLVGSSRRPGRAAAPKGELGSQRISATCVNLGGMTLAVPQGSGHSARRVGSAGRLTWGFVATGTLLLAWGAPELM